MSTRSLCNTCAKYDWPYHLTRHLGLNGTAQSIWAANGVDHGGGDPSYARKPPPTNGLYWIDGSSTLFDLDPLPVMLKNHASCSVCKLVVDATKTFADPQRLHHFLEHEGHVACQSYDPESNALVDYAVIAFTVEADVGDENENMALWFSAYVEDDASTAVATERTGIQVLHSRHVLDAGQIDLDMVRTWWQDCRDGHEDCDTLSLENRFRTQDPSTSSLDDRPVLRVIDTFSDQVVLAPADCKYVALSYVWGDIAVYQARRRDFVDPFPPPTSTMASRSTEQFLPLTRTRLPQTIQDAMAVVQAIGERYLWVDALCIVQDDEVEKMNTIRAMNKIYQCALLTIVAASGTHANAGLPGVRPASRTVVSVKGTVEGIPLVNAEESISLGESPWSLRGWTYQEEFFSKRCIIFANERVFYECGAGCWGEARPRLLLPHRLRGAVIGEGGGKIHASDAWGEYSHQVSGYTRRELRYETDILNAFAGILAEYESAVGLKSCWGLPVDEFDRALLWVGRDNRRGLRRRSHAVASVLFPSWSWTGWVGSVSYRRHLQSFASYMGIYYVKSAVTWPWIEGYDILTGGDVLTTGVLTFQAFSAVLDHALLEKDPGFARLYEQGRFDETLPKAVRDAAYFRFDDGSLWTRGERECVLLGLRVPYSSEGEPANLAEERNDHAVMVVWRDNKNGRELYFRKGVLMISKEAWERAEPQLKLVRLG